MICEIYTPERSPISRQAIALIVHSQNAHDRRGHLAEGLSRPIDVCSPLHCRSDKHYMQPLKPLLSVCGCCSSCKENDCGKPADFSTKEGRAHPPSTFVSLEQHVNHVPSAKWPLGVFRMAYTCSAGSVELSVASSHEGSSVRCWVEQRDLPTYGRQYLKHWARTTLNGVALVHWFRVSNFGISSYFLTLATSYHRTSRSGVRRY